MGDIHPFIWVLLAGVGATTIFIGCIFVVSKIIGLFKDTASLRRSQFNYIEYYSLKERGLYKKIKKLKKKNDLL